VTGKQRRHLRALGHHLNAVVHIGHEGISDALVKETTEQLETHELIKVKVGDGDRHVAAELLAQRTGSEVAQVLGRTALLYKPRKEKPEIELPK
jgi:RNA-binding protein